MSNPEPQPTSPPPRPPFRSRLRTLFVATIATAIFFAVVAVEVLSCQDSRSGGSQVLWRLQSMTLSAIIVRYAATRATKRLSRLTHHVVGLFAGLVGAIIGSMGLEAIFESSCFRRDFDDAWAASVILGFIVAAIVEVLAAKRSST